jgi:hypothetical protein
MSSGKASSSQLYQLSAHVVGFGFDGEIACQIWSLWTCPMQHWSRKMHRRQTDAFWGSRPGLLAKIGKCRPRFEPMAD